MKYMIKMTIIIISLLSLIQTSQAQKSNVNSQSNYSHAEEKLKKWFDNTIQNQHLLMKSHESININTFRKEYEVNKIYWDSAFAFLRNINLSEMAPGKYPIIGEQVFATISENIPKSMNELQWESHRKYIDLHHVINGKEIIGITNISRVKVTKDYTVDIMNYQGKGDMFESDSTIFFIAFPEDIHMPNIQSSGFDKVKKLVIKIEVAEQLQKKN